MLGSPRHETGAHCRIGLLRIKAPRKRGATVALGPPRGVAARPTRSAFGDAGGHAPRLARARTGISGEAKGSRRDGRTSAARRPAAAAPPGGATAQRDEPGPPMIKQHQS